jgi:hypothetical protein
MKKVEVYELNEMRDRQQYTVLMNNPNVVIVKEEFSYMKDGTPKITVWYEIEDSP